MALVAISDTRLAISARFLAARRRTLELCEPLTPEDMMVQSCPEASPAKWHLAHTAWFFESFILAHFLPGYRLFNADFPWLFNSYYRSFAEFPEKRLRSSFSRPGLDQILAYRAHVDEAIARLIDGNPDSEALNRIELGVNHEEQHQELLLTDILNVFYTNPLRPAYRPEENPSAADGPASAMQFVSYPGGLVEIGHSGGGFCYDNELPRHRVWLEPYSLADRLVTNGEFAEFIADGGYRKSNLWLSDGWDAVEQNGWRAPLYWNEQDGDWTLFSLTGSRSLDEVRNAPVAHISYFEAEAYARWAGKRLPTEFEWESAAQPEPVEGNLMESLRFAPRPVESESSGPLRQCFDDCWEWTSSAYLGYPGYQPLTGSLGEYNGKFMSGQMVLRGGSCVTPKPHIRASYRNFFAPHTRWQFSGLRLANW